MQSLFGKHHHMVCITVNMLVAGVWCQKQLPLHGNIPAADQETMILRLAAYAALKICYIHTKTYFTDSGSTISLKAYHSTSLVIGTFMLFPS